MGMLIFLTMLIMLMTMLLFVMISFYIFSKRFFLKREGLSDARITSITKKEYGFCGTFFVKILKVFKVNI